MKNITTRLARVSDVDDPKNIESAALEGEVIQNSAAATEIALYLNLDAPDLPNNLTPHQRVVANFMHAGEVNFPMAEQRQERKAKWDKFSEDIVERINAIHTDKKLPLFVKGKTMQQVLDEQNRRPAIAASQEVESDQVEDAPEEDESGWHEASGEDDRHDDQVSSGAPKLDKSNHDLQPDTDQHTMDQLDLLTGFLVDED